MAVQAEYAFEPELIPQASSLLTFLQLLGGVVGIAYVPCYRLSRVRLLTLVEVSLGQSSATNLVTSSQAVDYPKKSSMVLSSPSQWYSAYLRRREAQ